MNRRYHYLHGLKHPKRWMQTVEKIFNFLWVLGWIMLLGLVAMALLWPKGYEYLFGGF